MIHIADGNTYSEGTHIKPRQAYLLAAPVSQPGADLLRAMLTLLKGLKELVMGTDRYAYADEEWNTTLPPPARSDRTANRVVQRVILSYPGQEPPLADEPVAGTAGCCHKGYEGL